MGNNILFVLVAGLLALVFSYWKTSWIENQDQGTERMKVIGASIADGAMAFLRAEYRVLTVFVVAVAILLGLANMNSPESSAFIALSFLINGLSFGIDPSSFNLCIFPFGVFNNCA